MSGELAPRRPGAVAQQPEMSAEFVKQMIEQPLRQLPKAWQLPVWDFWSFFSNLLKNQLALCSRIRHWQQCGVQLGDLQVAFRTMRHPERAGRYKFDSEVLADLATLVATAKRSREEMEDTRRMRESNPDRLPPDQIRSLLQEYAKGTTLPAHDAADPETRKGDSSRGSKSADRGGRGKRPR